MNRSISSILVVVIVAGLSAILGSLVARQSLDAYVSQLQQVPLSIDGLSQRRPLAIPGNYSDALDNVSQNAQPGVVAVIRPTDSAHAEGVNGAAARGVAMVMTSDGWLLTHSSVATLSHAALFDREVAQIEKVIPIPDTDLAFVKVSGDRGRVMTFGESENIEVGALVFALGPDSLYPRTVSSTSPHELAPTIESSSLWRRYELDLEIDGSIGLPVVDSSGALVGVFDEGGYVRPWHTIGPLLPQVFDSNAIELNDLGLRIIDRERIFSETVQDGLEVHSVASRSLAAKAGVSAGDIITRVNGKDSNDKPISEELIQFVGDEFTLTIEREGVVEDIVINLGGNQ